ncbi:MAG: hypothetical protein OXF05_06255, partial [Hyphomicrobiales bacterium]|nr:hypothetical protein [Hyphomicrobiales bacterium]
DNALPENTNINIKTGGTATEGEDYNITADTSSNYPRMRVDLSRSFGRDVTIKLVVSGTAMYDSETTPSGTYRVETRVLPAGEMPPTTFNINDGTICAQTVARSTGCDITIQSGQSVVDIALFSRGALTSGHDITLTLSVASASSSLVLPGSPLTHTLTVQ